MVQSPSWEANWLAGSQEIPHISWNLKVHYRNHKRLPPVSILGQPNPVHIPTSHLLEIHPHIIHPSMPRSHQWSLSLRFPHQDPIHPPLLTHTCHMPCPFVYTYISYLLATSIWIVHCRRPNTIACLEDRQCYWLSSPLKMETECFSGTLIPVDWTTKYHIMEDHNLDIAVN